MEAMAMELPCVATYVAGNPELIRHEENGLLAPASDTESFAAALARLMDDLGLRRRLGVAARETVLRDFDLTKNSAHLAGIFQRWLT
jgi:glycosyltransferase involved in cell wall biosynthesis